MQRVAQGVYHNKKKLNAENRASLGYYDKTTADNRTSFFYHDKKNQCRESHKFFFLEPLPLSAAWRNARSD